MASSLSLNVEIFEWPDRFFVEAKEPDRDYGKFFPQVENEVSPHLVDLSEPPKGRCDCRDFRFNIEPLLVNEKYKADPNQRLECGHILAARRYKALLGEKPKKLPDTINI